MSGPDRIGEQSFKLEAFSVFSRANAAKSTGLEPIGKITLDFAAAHYTLCIAR